jgi:hypothetical protein
MPAWTSSKSCSPECARSLRLKGRKAAYDRNKVVKATPEAVEIVDEDALFEHNVLRMSLGLDPVEVLP